MFKFIKILFRQSFFIVTRKKVCRHFSYKIDATTTEKTSSNDEDEENFDPNGHGHGKTNKFKADGMMGDMMKQFMGYSKMFTARNAQPKKRQIETVSTTVVLLIN